MNLNNDIENVSLSQQKTNLTKDELKAIKSLIIIIIIIIYLYSASSLGSKRFTHLSITHGYTYKTSLKHIIIVQFHFS